MADFFFFYQTVTTVCPICSLAKCDVPSNVCFKLLVGRQTLYIYTFCTFLL